MPDNAALQALIDDSSNWMRGEVPMPGKIGIGSLFRTLKTPIPEAPQTLRKVGDAFSGYRQSIKETLKPGGMTDDAWEGLLQYLSKGRR